MYKRVMDAIIRRADMCGVAYVEDYGSSLHLTARLPYEVTVSIINQMEHEGKLKVTRTETGKPIKVKVS